MHVLFSRDDRDRRCRVIFPANYGYDLMAEPWRDLRPTPGKRRVLHLGDSMLNSFRSVVFTQRLAELRPGEAHLNLGVGGLAPDAYGLVLRRWLDRVRPDEVFVHLFLGNDLNEFPEYQCCEAGPLVAFAGGAMTQRCESPRWSDDRRTRWRLGPAPYSLRVLGHSSIAAARVVERMERSMRSMVTPTTRSGALGWGSTRDRDRNRLLLAAIRDEVARRGVPLTFALLPARWTLESDDPDDPVRGHHVEVIELARELGVRAVDPWDAFLRAARNPAADLWFDPANHRDPHLGNAGPGIIRKLPHLGDAGRGLHRKPPHMGDAGRGGHRAPADLPIQLPHLGGNHDSGRGVHSGRAREDLRAYLGALSARLRRVRVACGDWSRVCTDSASISIETVLLSGFSASNTIVPATLVNMP
jgi:hypothetical protein